MIIECKDADGFEDSITLGQDYRVESIGQNSYLIEDDNGQKRWFGRCKFDVVFMV